MCSKTIVWCSVSRLVMVHTVMRIRLHSLFVLCVYMAGSNPAHYISKNKKVNSMKQTELKRTSSFKKGPSKLKQNTMLKAKSELKSNTSLKSKTSLQSNTVLKSNSSLKANTALQSHTRLQNHGSVLNSHGSQLKQKTPLSASSELTTKTKLKTKQKTAKKLSGEYNSIFGSLNICAITGEKKQKIGKGKWSVVPHHIFGGAYKAKSELYGFILPLRVDWHTGHAYSIHEDSKLDLKYKRICQDYYVNVLKKTKEEFIKEFGKWY